MNATELESLLSAWRHLTEAERDAIADDDWAEVHRQQHDKAELQGRISLAARDWTKDSPVARQMRPLIQELIALEADNARLVALRRDHTRGALAETERTAGQLRGLNRAYGTAADANWTSYS